MITDRELARLAAPTLFVWGSDEPHGPPHVAERAAALMPDARVDVVPDAWHHPWLADGARTSELVCEFLAERLA